jgi:hypothetical protein
LWPIAFRNRKELPRSIYSFPGVRIFSNLPENLAESWLIRKCIKENQEQEPQTSHELKLPLNSKAQKNKRKYITVIRKALPPLPSARQHIGKVTTCHTEKKD